MSTPSKEKTVSGFFWRFLERCCSYGISFVVSIVLARILDPSYYGEIALITVFTAILQVFINGGFGSALIQKKDADDLDFSSVFYFNLAMCICLYALMYVAAPWIAEYYENERLVPLIRVVSLSLVLSGLKNIQYSYVSKHMLFRKFFFSTIGGTIVSGAVGLYMAYAGYGVWALVAQSLLNEGVAMIILWITVPWHPKWQFSFSRIKILFGFGWKILVSTLLDSVYNEIRQLVIGKRYSSEALAYYNRGKTFPSMINTNVVQSLDSVLFPTMSNAQDSPEQIKAVVRRSIKTSTYIMAPLLLGLAACASSVVELLLTEKWLPCVFYMQIFCITFVFYPIHSSNLSAIKALGRSDLFLTLQIVRTVIGLAAVVATAWISVEALALSMLVTSLLSTVVNSYPNKKLIGYMWFEQMKDIIPQLLVAFAMAVPVFFMQYLPLPTIVLLVLQVIAGAAIYLLLSMLFKLESYVYTLNILKGLLKRRKKV